MELNEKPGDYTATIDATPAPSADESRFGFVAMQNLTPPSRCTMLRLFTIFTASALVLAGSSASAAPRPEEKGGGPAIIGQAKSFNDLLDITKSMVKNVG